MIYFIYDYTYDLKSPKLYYSKKNKSIDIYYIILQFHYYKVIIFYKNCFLNNIYMIINMY
jgi:hypothetical protein